jgi:hypothetical protein
MVSEQGMQRRCHRISGSPQRIGALPQAVVGSSTEERRRSYRLLGACPDEGVGEARWRQTRRSFSLPSSFPYRNIPFEFSLLYEQYAHLGIFFYF